MGSPSSLRPVLTYTCYIHSDPSPLKSLWGLGEGETGEGGGESALPRREDAPIAALWTVSGRSASKGPTRKKSRLTFWGKWISNINALSLLQTLCRQLHSKIDVVDEERYDCESKVNKHNKDVSLWKGFQLLANTHPIISRNWVDIFNEKRKVS